MQGKIVKVSGPLIVASGMADAIDELRRRGCVIFGVCGGYQMLGREISDPDRTEEGGQARAASARANRSILPERLFLWNLRPD